MRFLILMIALATAVSARATGLDKDALLRLDADLVIHPAQVEAVLTSALSSHDLKISELKLEKPYRVTLSRVEALGPWEISSSVNQREFGFSFVWPNPELKISEFSIRDTVSRVVGGVPININLDGMCRDLHLQIPGGDWRVSGRMRWDVISGRLVPVWNSFEFLGAQSAVGEVSVASCEGPSIILTSIRELLTRAASDHTWFEPLLKQGLLDLAQSRLGEMSDRLLARHEFSVFDPLVGAWVPSGLSALGDGLLRVEGEIVLSVPGSDLGADHVERGYDPSVLLDSSDSGFTISKNALEHVLRFLQTNGLLQYRLSSYDIPAFQSLMWNRFAQFFVWPDLLSFARESQFYFYLSAQSAPQVNGLEVAFPMSVQQWAPVANGNYLPYLNFQSYIQGHLTTDIRDNKLALRLQPYDLNLTYSFARDYQRARRVNSRLAIGLIGSSVRDYLNEKSFEFILPTLPLTSNQNVLIREIHFLPQYLRLTVAP